jgi:hypothetical protein
LSSLLSGAEAELDDEVFYNDMEEREGLSYIGNMHDVFEDHADTRTFLFNEQDFYFGRSGVAPHNTLFSCTLLTILL